MENVYNQIQFKGFISVGFKNITMLIINLIIIIFKFFKESIPTFKKFVRC